LETIPEKSKFLWVGNNTAIDFINTQIVVDGADVDLLEDSSDVARWMNEAGLLASSSVPKNLLEEATGYRAQLHQGIVKLTNGLGISTALVDATNAYLSRRAAWQKLEQDKSGYRVTTVFQPERAPDYLLAIAQSFAMLLAEGDLSRLRKCVNPYCVLYYYDTSKGGQRSWCSLDLCGNKLRMAASRARRSLAAR
jgi:predicted RNA-binding Zn ribbon-like protein